MEIQVNENIRLRSDVYNIILEQKSVTKKGDNAGTVVWNTMGYYPTIEIALCSYIDKTIRSADTKDIFELVELIKKTKDEIMNMGLNFKREGKIEEEEEE